MGIALMECYICMLRHGNVIYDTEELNTRYIICIIALWYIDRYTAKINNYRI